MEIGKKMFMLRKSTGLTQAELGEIFNIDAATINRYERGSRQPNKDYIAEFANYFEVSTDYLLDNSDSSYYMAKVNLVGEFIEGKQLTKPEDKKFSVFISPGAHPWDCFIIKTLSNYDEFKIDKDSLCLIKKDNVDLGALHIIEDENQNYHLGILKIHDGHLTFNNKRLSQDAKIIGKVLSIVFDLHELQNLQTL